MSRPRTHPIPQIGSLHGDLTVTRIDIGKKSNVFIVCLCKCGNKCRVAPSRISKQKRCKRCENRIKSPSAWMAMAKYTGIVQDSRTRRRLCRIIYGATSRCLNKGDKEYKNYGGRGISILPSWVEDKAKFMSYLVSLPGHENPDLELDRIDNSKGYYPRNLRFSTQTEQVRNRRCSSWVTFGGRRWHIVSFMNAHLPNISLATIRRRALEGYTGERMIKRYS